MCWRRKRKDRAPHDPKKFHRVAFFICLISTILLFTGGAFTPPLFILDASILYAAGILMGFATVAEIPYLVEQGKGASIKIGDKIEVDVGNNNDKEHDCCHGNMNDTNPVYPEEEP